MARRAPGWPAGILLLDKPQGWTSHDVVAKARGICHQRRIGHTGTLDPMATGLLVLCLGHATRLVEYMSEHDKQYVGEIVLGVSTDTDDAEGQVIAKQPVPPLDDAVLRSLEQEFTGVIEQVPPAYSAVKVEGQRAYAVARRGGELDLAARPVRIDRIRLALLEPGRLSIHLGCGPGTYVRSIARDIGAAVGCGAHLAALRRTRVGQFDIGEAMTIEQLQAYVIENRLHEVLRTADEGLMDLDAAIVSAEHGRALRNGLGIAVAVPPARSAKAIRVYDTSGYFVATGRFDISGKLRPAKVMPEISLMSSTDTNSD
ncbi:MAG: tRNA pseudouridine(55) synthase TruB [Dehalococcoidia bacterium]|nr:tRNA pseudouridine(55) synthase TruB [Dehalococcoidia bacterium]